MEWNYNLEKAPLDTPLKLQFNDRYCSMSRM